MTNEELWKKLKELNADKQAQACPSCGHCPTCGRGGHQVMPWYPMPYYQPYPWYSGTVKIGYHDTTGLTSGSGNFTGLTPSVTYTTGGN